MFKVRISHDTPWWKYNYHTLYCILFQRRSTIWSLFLSIPPSVHVMKSPIVDRRGFRVFNMRHFALFVSLSDQWPIPMYTKFLDFNLITLQATKCIHLVGLKGEGVKSSTYSFRRERETESWNGQRQGTSLKYTRCRDSWKCWDQLFYKTAVPRCLQQPARVLTSIFVYTWPSMCLVLCPCNVHIIL